MQGVKLVNSMDPPNYIYLIPVKITGFTVHTKTTTTEGFIEALIGKASTIFPSNLPTEWMDARFPLS